PLNTFQANDLYPMSVVAADFTSDGVPDVVTANIGRNTLSLMASTDDGLLADPKELGGGANPFPLVAGDLNGDCRPDLVTGNAYSEVWVLMGLGAGRFQTEQRFQVDARPGALALADMNRDGKLDIVGVRGQANEVFVLYSMTASP
ncbi:MAG TPA: VCBS repeat-containing protein, partial [Polyangiaceae bacterium]|nr:VCBS repeat-containing protein [Polyangiaceae bacterium]